MGARTHPTNPIANHAGWQGKVFKIDGSDKKYPNLKESTGYPDDILGLGGVNCRHRMFPFFPGISTPNPIRFNEEENRHVYELTQKQRSMERRMRQLKKEQAAAKEIGDKETAKELNKKISEQSTKIDEFCKKNNLRRDHSRELVKEQIIKNNVHRMGNIYSSPLEKEFGKLKTKETVITDERLKHIKERHPEDYELFKKYGSEAIKNPDIIISDFKNENTVFMVKRLGDTNINVVTKLILKTDDSKFKNSVLTFYRIRDKNLIKAAKKGKTLYIKE